MKVTRRELTVAMIASAAAAQAAQPPANPADPLDAARQRVRANTDILTRQELPMTAEPAFRFEA